MEIINPTIEPADEDFAIFLRWSVACIIACSPSVRDVNRIEPDTIMNCHQWDESPKHHWERRGERMHIMSAPDMPAKAAQRLSILAIFFIAERLPRLCATSRTPLWRKPRPVRMVIVSIVVLKIPNKPIPTAPSHIATSLVLMIEQRIFNNSAPEKIPITFRTLLVVLLKAIFEVGLEGEEFSGNKLDMAADSG